MSWPALVQLEQGIDASEWQLAPNFSVVKTEHPGIKVVIVRLADVWLQKDDRWPQTYLDALAEGYKTAVYVNFNPSRSLDEHEAAWDLYLDGVEPQVFVIDCESSAGQSPRVITTKLGELNERMLAKYPSSSVHLVMDYTAAWWWNPNILHDAPWIATTLFWIAHYPYLVEDADGTWRTAISFEEVDPLLPIHNGFTPRLPTGIAIEQVVGWQFSDKGIIKGIARPYYTTPRTDLNYFKKWWVDAAWDVATPPPGVCDIPEWIPADMRSIADRMRDDADELDAMAQTLEEL